MIDSVIIISYFIFVLILGFYKGLNIKSVCEYSIADKNYSLPIMVATMTATGFGGGSTFGITSSVFSFGIVFIFIALGNPINLWLAAQFLVKQIDAFENSISVGEMMGKFYGTRARIITGAFGALYCAAAVGGQVSAIGFIVQYFLDLPYLVGVLCGCGIVIIYSAFGGIKAVTATDVLQFAVLIIAIPMVCNVGLNFLGGYPALLQKVPSHLLDLPNTAPAMINYFFIFLGFTIPFLDPPTMQRLLMAKNLNQIKRMLRIGAVVMVPLYLIVGIIGLIAASAYPNLESNLAFPHLINTILPLGLKGIAVIGLLSVVMSTADSYLNAASISLVHDTIKPILGSSLSDPMELRLLQITTIVLGTLATIIALSFSSIMGIILFSLNFWGPIIVVPLYAALLGYKASSRCFYAGISCGIAMFAFWTIFIEPRLLIESLIPSMIANALGFFIAYRIEKKPMTASSGYMVAPQLDRGMH